MKACAKLNEFRTKVKTGRAESDIIVEDSLLAVQAEVSTPMNPVNFRKSSDVISEIYNASWSVIHADASQDHILYHDFSSRETVTQSCMDAHIINGVLKPSSEESQMHWLTPIRQAARMFDLMPKYERDFKYARAEEILVAYLNATGETIDSINQVFGINQVNPSSKMNAFTLPGNGEGMALCLECKMPPYVCFSVLSKFGRCSYCGMISARNCPQCFRCGNELNALADMFGQVQFVKETGLEQDPNEEADYLEAVTGTLDRADQSINRLVNRLKQGNAPDTAYTKMKKEERSRLVQAVKAGYTSFRERCMNDLP